MLIIFVILLIVVAIIIGVAVSMNSKKWREGTIEWTELLSLIQCLLCTDAKNQIIDQKNVRTYIHTISNSTWFHM